MAVAISCKGQQVPERVSTASFVVLRIGNSKSSHLGVQGTVQERRQLQYCLPVVISPPAVLLRRVSPRYRRRSFARTLVHLVPVHIHIVFCADCTSAQCVLRMLHLAHPRAPRVSISLYKILFRFKALLWECIILLLPPPTCNAYPIVILLHGHCVIYAPPMTLPVYAIHHTI